jgi:hypothetical protein
MEIGLDFFKNSFYATYIKISKWETHIHDISNTYVPIPQLFAKGESLKSEGIGMPRDKNEGLHGDLGHVEPIYRCMYMYIWFLNCFEFQTLSGHPWFRVCACITHVTIHAFWYWFTYVWVCAWLVKVPEQSLILIFDSCDIATCLIEFDDK